MLGTSPFVAHVVCKYYLLALILSFHPLNRILCKAEVFNVDEVQFYFFLFWTLSVALDPKAVSVILTLLSMDCHFAFTSPWS